MFVFFFFPLNIAVKISFETNRKFNDIKTTVQICESKEIGPSKKCLHYLIHWLEWQPFDEEIKLLFLKVERGQRSIKVFSCMTVGQLRSQTHHHVGKEMCAVLTWDTIVVMGDLIYKYEELKSMECIIMDNNSSWTYLPSMSEPRYGANAQVLPIRLN